MATEKLQHCFYCGDLIGCYKSYPGDVESCGKAECERELRHMMDEERSNRMERAEADDYDYYGKVY